MESMRHPVTAGHRADKPRGSPDGMAGNRHGRIAWWLAALTLLSACVMPASPSGAMPGSSPAATAIATSVPPTAATAAPATWTPTATATLSPTATPDLDAARATAVAGLAGLEAVAADAHLVCLRYEDTDSDGEPEWLALFHRAGPDGGRLSAYVLDGPASFELAPARPKPGSPEVGLGEYPVCDLQVRDLNLDGTPDIAIFGHAADNRTLLHLFTWDGTHYLRLGVFAGDAGVTLTDDDGDLTEEVREGYRVRAAPDLAWYAIYTWRHGAYGWTTDYYDWYFTDRPQSYPTHRPEYAVISFYLALNDRDLLRAYELLDPDTRESYEDWALGYATLMRVRVGSVHPIPDTLTETHARVAAMVTTWHNEEGVVVGRLWDTEWNVVRAPEGWRLMTHHAQELETWVATYTW